MNKVWIERILHRLAVVRQDGTDRYVALMKSPENRRLRATFIWSVCALLIIGGQSLALIQSHQSETKSAKSATDATSALKTADRAITCLNNVLGARAKKTSENNQAVVDTLTALKDDAVSFRVILLDILNSSPSTKSTPDFLAYLKVDESYVNTLLKSAQTLAANQGYLNRHPIGSC